jgi:hypothetical protein
MFSVRRVLNEYVKFSVLNLGKGKTKSAINAAGVTSLVVGTPDV